MTDTNNQDIDLFDDLEGQIDRITSDAGEADADPARPRPRAMPSLEGLRTISATSTS